MIIIKSLTELKEWNSNPTSEKPIVMDWFNDWIIDECPEDFMEFIDAIETYIFFTEKVENLSRSDSIVRTVDNLRYWYRRSSKNNKRFKLYFNNLIIKYFGL